MAHLIQKLNDQEIGRWELGDEPLLMGRSVGAQLFIEDPGVSREHCRIEQVENGFGISDLGSHNGTFVNGEKIAAQKQLSHGDEIVVGKYMLQFIDEDSAMKAPAAPKDEEPESVIWSVLIAKDGNEKRLSLLKPDYTIGRSGECDITLDEKKSSNCHALAVVGYHNIRLINVSESKPMTINGEATSKKQVLSPGTVIMIGDTTLTFIGES